MKVFVDKLEKETEARLQVVETMEADMLKKALEASHILGNAFDRLKDSSHLMNLEMQMKKFTFSKISNHVCAPT